MLKIIKKTLIFNGKSYPCAHGRGGYSSNKKEGDGATPLGTFALRECWYRADRIAKPQTKLPLRIISENDGWCDDPESGEYNRHIKVPPPIGGRLGGGRDTEKLSVIMPPPQPSPYGGGSYENLWRSDHAYDLIVPLGYNDDPVVPGKGSAIFLHVMHDDARSTEGCIALAKSDLLAILPALDTHTIIEIKE